jgi:two-component system sensor histidine kinase KdpD
VYGREKAERAIQNFFRESTLVALRELALRQAAHEVEQRISDADNGSSPERSSLARNQSAQRILVYLTAEPQTAMLIRRAKRVSDFVGAECFAVIVQPSGDLSTLPENDRDEINRHLNFARNLHIETRILEGEDTAFTLVDFARRNQITQIFLARHQDRRVLPLFGRSLAQKIVALAKDMQVVIVSEREALTR